MKIINKKILLKIIIFIIMSYLQSYAKWERTSVPENGQMKINAICCGDLYAATDSSLYISYDTGATWQIINGAPKNILSLDCKNFVFIGTKEEGIIEKHPGGAWIRYGLSRLGAIYSIKFILPPAYFFIGTDNGIYIYDYLLSDTNQITHIFYQKVKALAATYYNSYYIRPTTYTMNYYYFYASTDIGIYFADLSFNSETKETKYIKNWSLINDSIKNITSLASPYDYFNSNTNIILAGTSNNGIFISFNKGLSWKEFNEGLDELNVTTLCYPEGNILYLFAATYTNGKASIWRRPLTDITSVTTIPKNIHSQASNLEFNVSNNILKYKLSKTSDVEIRIYDLKGKVIFNTRFYNQMQGEYLLSLMQRGINAGVYILELKAVGNKIQKPINIIRR